MARIVAGQERPPRASGDEPSCQPDSVVCFMSAPRERG